MKSRVFLRLVCITSLQKYSSSLRSTVAALNSRIQMSTVRLWCLVNISAHCESVCMLSSVCCSRLSLSTRFDSEYDMGTKRPLKRRPCTLEHTRPAEPTAHRRGAAKSRRGAMYYIAAVHALRSTAKPTFHRRSRLDSPACSYSARAQLPAAGARQAASGRERGQINRRVRLTSLGRLPVGYAAAAIRIFTSGV